MEFAVLVDAFEELDETQSTLEKTRILSDLFAEANDADLEKLVTMVRGKVFASWESKELGVSTSLTREAISKSTGIQEPTIEDWWRETGDLGNAAAKAVANKTQQTLLTQQLDVETVYTQLRELAEYEGEGSQQKRVDAIANLLTSANQREARFIVRIIVGAMRVGVGKGLIRDALADGLLDGSEQAIQAVERGYEVTNDYRVVATTARDEGIEGLESLSVQLFRPIKPMLAQQSEGLEDALSTIRDDHGEPVLDVKYDGIRAKIHALDDEIRVFTRRLEEISTQFPDIVSAVDELVSAESFIMEAEVVGYDPETGNQVPFQELSRRIKRKYDIEEMAEEIPVTVYAFDLLYLNGESLLETPLRTRLEKLSGILSTEDQRLERAEWSENTDVEAATEFYESALADGHEGIMVKNLDAAYQPGSRVGYQLKVKPTMEPLDLVVTRAKWSEGRKSDFLGRPYLGCYDQETDEFLEVGRMHSGFTDEQLAGITERLEPHITEVDGREAKLNPEVVIQVEYEEIQESPKYGSGFALRFPRFEGFRDDLAPTDADTIEKVTELYHSQ